MAKIEGTQNIPSEWKTFYDGTLTPAMPNNIVRGRFPWKLPAFRDGGYKVTEAQKGQRERVKAIRDKFANVSWEVRQRWYAARPPWGSLLWYYNYFMLSGLMGNAVINDKGAGVIKDINHYTFNIPYGSAVNVTIAVDTCDPTKSVPFFFGAVAAEVGEGIFIPNYPYLVSLNSTQLIAKASMNVGLAGDCSVTLIEYI